LSDFSKSHKRGYGHVNVLPHLFSTTISLASELVAAFDTRLWRFFAAVLIVPGRLLGVCFHGPFMDSFFIQTSRK